MGFQTDHMILFQVVQRDLDISPCHLALFAQFRHRGDPVSRFQPCQDLRDLQRCQTRLVFIMVALPFSTYLSIRIRWTVGNSTGKKRILGVPPLLTRDRSLADS